MSAIAPLSTPRVDRTAAVALARLPDPPSRLSVSIAAHLVAAAEAGRVTCPKVAILVELWAREIAA